MLGFEEVEKYDPELAQAMSDELTRQRTHIELIASENLVSKAVMAAMGSVLTNKYAEGYPEKRYYGGCEYVDVVEEFSKRARKRKLFLVVSMSMCSRTLEHRQIWQSFFAVFKSW